MKVAIGLKAHSGWAVAVAVGLPDGQVQLVDRCRLSLVDSRSGAWARQPYHAAEGMPPVRAEAIVREGIEGARQASAQGVSALIGQLHDAGHEIAGGAVLTGSPMPAWTTEQILAVHIRMHQAEGQLFPDALAAAVCACGLPLGLLREKELDELAPSACPWTDAVAALGKWAGPPWGADQKHAALAALVIFGSRLQ
ncbi:MAG TPA: hypothetical protein VFG49_00100 [Dyella sp.]|uniref:hypothetical protein n=1 Tax=Dyella sp. TaxID=1869338 RepID=UPI002D79A67D|nr:hypothetical protein [Dyella sp.]HET6551916.1 hypothetical protein [Dyella sp.]